MFSLDNNQLFTWYNIFLVMGLDKSIPFLFDIGFPLLNKYRDIQQISQEFVKKVFDNELKLFDKGKPSLLSESLFQEVYALLVKQIGEEDAKSFCKWGNKLKVDTKIEDKLLNFWDILRKKSHINNHFNDSKIFLLQMLVNHYNHYFQSMDNSRYDIENIARNDWEDLAYVLYYRIGDDRRTLNTRIAISPLDFLDGIITYYSLTRLIIQLQLIPEIEILLMRLELDKAYNEIKQLLV